MNNGSWMYANSLIAAAREVAKAQYGTELTYQQEIEICRDYGVFLEQMNDKEYDEFERLVMEYS